MIRMEEWQELDRMLFGSEDEEEDGNTGEW
jgi:hypothetical protein